MLQAVEVGPQAPPKVSKLHSRQLSVLLPSETMKVAYSNIVRSGLEVVDRLDEWCREHREPEE
jgi:hypothetical protein